MCASLRDRSESRPNKPYACQTATLWYKSQPRRRGGFRGGSGRAALRADVACDCRPFGLTRMGTAYRLNEFGSGPLWLLDTAADPRIVFVPAAR